MRQSRRDSASADVLRLVTFSVFRERLLATVVVEHGEEADLAEEAGIFVELVKALLVVEEVTGCEGGRKQSHQILTSLEGYQYSRYQKTDFAQRIRKRNSHYRGPKRSMVKGPWGLKLGANGSR